MADYATLAELEKTALEYREDLLGEGKSMEVVAEKVGKPLRPLDELDRMITSATGDYQRSLRLEEVPQLWRDLAELYLPAETVDSWFNDKQAFAGSSPRERLSVLEPADLKSSVGQMASILYEVLAFASVPALPSKEQLFYVTRLAQYEQLQE